LTKVNSLGKKAVGLEVNSPDSFTEESNTHTKGKKAITDKITRYI